MTRLRYVGGVRRHFRPVAQATREALSPFCGCGRGKGGPHRTVCRCCEAAAPDAVLDMCADPRTRAEGFKQLIAFAKSRFVVSQQRPAMKGLS